MEHAFAVSGVDIDLAKTSSIDFTIRGDSNNLIDELRIGTTYASVVLELASAALVLVGLGLLGTRARFGVVRRR